MHHKFESFRIRTDRLSIRPLQDEDLTLLNRAISDSFQELHRWTEWAIKPQSMSDTMEYIEFSKKCWSEKTPEELPLLIFDPTEKKLIGAVAFNAINWNIPMFELGYWVNTAHAGKGYITEVVNVLSHFAFSKWRAKRLEIRCDEDNVKSAEIPKRLGFALEAHFKNHRIQPFTHALSGTLVFVRYDAEDLPKIEYQIDNVK